MNKRKRMSRTIQAARTLTHTFVPWSKIELDLGLGAEREGRVVEESHLFSEVAEVVSQRGKVELRRGVYVPRQVLHLGQRGRERGQVGGNYMYLTPTQNVHIQMLWWLSWCQVYSYTCITGLNPTRAGIFFSKKCQLPWKFCK